MLCDLAFPPGRRPQLFSTNVAFLRFLRKTQSVCVCPVARPFAGQVRKLKAVLSPPATTRVIITGLSASDCVSVHVWVYLLGSDFPDVPVGRI